MNASEILELVRAGYSKEEIEKMSTPIPDGDEHNISLNDPEPASDIASEQDNSDAGDGEGSQNDDQGEAVAADPTPEQLPNNANAAELEAIKAQIAAQTADLKSLKEQLIDKRINEDTAKKEDINIYDMWADTLNN
jgi:hypothetical protein